MKWVPSTKWLLGVAGAACVAAIAGLGVLAPRVEGPVVTARVVGFGNNPSRFRPDVISIVAATPDGRSGEGVLTIDQLNELDCKIGDPVAARVVGAGLAINARSCGKAGLAGR